VKSGFNFMRNEIEKTSAAMPILGVFCASIIVMLLILAAERSGMPLRMSEWFVRIVIIAALSTCVWFGRSAVERLFFGREASAPWKGGGLILGLIILVSTQTHLGLSGSLGASVSWFGATIGSILGIITVHIFLRYYHKRNHQTLAEGISTAHSKQKKLILGLALCCLGAMIALLSLTQAWSNIALNVSGNQQAALPSLLFLAILGIALGGAKGSMAMIAMLSLIAMGGILFNIGIGLASFGTIPLPGFDEPATLKAIIEIKNSLGLSKAYFLQQWPELSMIFNLDGLTALTITALISGAVSLTFHPAIQLNKRSVAATASVTLFILPFLIIAIGGYAIEAAIEYLIGSPINNPPAALLDSTRLGLLQICGGFPETVEALRLQCSVTPRETTTLELARLKPQDGFLLTSLSVSLGYTATISRAIGIFPVALSLIGLVTGIWLMALGLGRYIMTQKQDAPGLASHRIASTRMATVLAAGLIMILVQFNLTPSAVILTILGATAAAVILFIQMDAFLSNIRAPRQNPQAA
jgi:hypothetical protein